MGMIFRNQRGVALILTIMIVILLVAITFQFGLGMRREYFSSANQKDTAVADAIALSGENVAMEILAWDSRTNGFDSLLDVWNKLSDRSFAPLFAQGSLHLVISDLSGKLQVNSLVAEKEGVQGASKATAQLSREILQRLLISGKFGDIQENEARGIVDSLVDWIDSDNQESPFGAENDYYRALDPPYDCKNGPVHFMEELLLVKGMNRDILYGNKDRKGLASYLTVHGNDGRININTADPVLLKALDSRMTQELVQEMVVFRTEEQNEQELSTPTWYRELTFWPNELTFDHSLTTTKSSYFKIVSVGKSRSLRIKDEAYVHRERDSKLTLLSRKVE